MKYRIHSGRIFDGRVVQHSKLVSSDRMPVLQRYTEKVWGGGGDDISGGPPPTGQTTPPKTKKKLSSWDKHELNTGHEVFGQWPVDSLFQCLFLTFLCFLSKKCVT